MFERFTDRARRSVVLAQEEARLLQHNYIGTEHVMLGLIHEGEGLAAQVLSGLGYTVDSVRASIEDMIGKGTDDPSGHIPFTPRSKKCMELSHKESLALGHNYIGTEHLLLGLLSEGAGVAAQILIKNGHPLGEVRTKTLEIMRSFEASKGSESAPAPARPACPTCARPLEETSTYRIVRTAEEGGSGHVGMLVVYCKACGHTIDTLIAPDAN